MANRIVTTSKIDAVNKAVEIGYITATVDTVNGAEVFEITPTRKDSEMSISISLGGVAGSGAVTVSFPSADLFGANSTSIVIPEGKTVVFIVDSSRVMTHDGNIYMTLTPATGKKLVTDTVAKVGFIERALTI